MNDWDTIRLTFVECAEELQKKIPSSLNQRLSYEDQKVSFWIQACPGFDSKIYITPELIGTCVDQDQCDLSCDFDAGTELTIRFTFDYFESLLTKKSRLCRWSKNGTIYSRSIDQWDGINWMNTQGNFPKNSKGYQKEFQHNDLNFDTEVNNNILDFSELLAYEQN